jgi:capsular polysaccharide biosynthesis protein
MVITESQAKRLRRFLQRLRRTLVIVVLGATIGAVVGFCVAHMIPERYEASVDLLSLSAAPNQSSHQVIDLDAQRAGVHMLTTYRALLVHPSFFQTAITDKESPSNQRMMEKLVIKQMPNSQIVTLSFEHSDKKQAIAVIDFVAKKLVTQVDTLFGPKRLQILSTGHEAVRSKQRWQIFYGSISGTLTWVIAVAFHFRRTMLFVIKRRARLKWCILCQETAKWLVWYTRGSKFR